MYYLYNMGRQLQNDLKDKSFGQLYVIQRTTSTSNAITWECVCDCGNKTTRTTSGLINAKSTPSCGCLGNPKNRKYTTAAEASVAAFQRRYQYDAKKRNLEWSLTPDEFECIIVQDCHYCGQQPAQKQNVYKKYGRSGTSWIDEADTYVNGIDRTDNTKGYTKINCVPCCSQCNYAKRSTHKNDFLNWIDRVYGHQHE